MVCPVCVSITSHLRLIRSRQLCARILALQPIIVITFLRRAKNAHVSLTRPANCDVILSEIRKQASWKLYTGLNEMVPKILNYRKVHA